MIQIEHNLPGSVGVAPGTTTLVFRPRSGNLNGRPGPIPSECRCAPDPIFRYITPPWNGIPKTAKKEKLVPVDPYGTDSYMRGASLGLIPNPFASAKASAKKWAMIAGVGLGGLWLIKLLAESA
jgi:hypothetical protein